VQIRAQIRIKRFPATIEYCVKENLESKMVNDSTAQRLSLRAEAWQLSKLASPIMIVSMLQFLMVMVDMGMVGRLGTEGVHFCVFMCVCCLCVFASFCPCVCTHVCVCVCMHVHTDIHINENQFFFIPDENIWSLSQIHPHTERHTHTHSQHVL